MDFDKISEWKLYVILRKIGDYTPPWRKALRPHLLSRRKEVIAEIEKKYPEFPGIYEEYVVHLEDIT